MRSNVRRRITAAVAAAAAIGAVVVASPANVVHAAPVSITLLNVNDFHGRIDPTNDLTTKWATTIENERVTDPNLLLLGAGDLIGASLFNSAVAKDQPTIDVMNEMCLNASSVGNHEFDQGYLDLTDRVVNGTPGQATDACPVFAGTQSPGTNAKWSYLGANVYQKGTQTPALPAYATFVVNGITVGVVGAVTSETPTLVSPGGITQIDVGDPVAAVNRVADQLTDGNQANGEADVLIAEFHEGAPDGTKTLNDNIAAGPAFASIVNGSSPKFSVLFTGHTHQAYVYTAPVNGGATGSFRPVLQTGSYADHVGKVVLSYDPTATPKVSVTSAANLNPAAAANLSFPRVAKVKAIVDAAKLAADAVGLQAIGTQTADITTAYTGGGYTGPGGTYVGSGGTNSKTGRDDRASESTIGDLVANALRDTLSPANLGSAQIGVVNPGGLRDELFFKQTGVEGDGTITYAEANNVLPFVNNLWTTTLTGAQFKTMLEQQWQRDAAGNVPTRPYLQLGLSDNVTYTYDASLPEGSRITSITINGAPYDPAASYRIGTFSFLITGGDNFRIFTSGTNAKDSGLVDRDGWISYLSAHKPVKPDFARQAVSVSPTPTIATQDGFLSFSVSKLDLTSLGSPANTVLTASIAGQELAVTTVTGGSATVDVFVPSTVPAGAQTLTLTARPSGTTVSLPIQVVDPTAQRLIDTRDGTGLPKGQLKPGVEAKLLVAGKYGVPADAKSLVLNITTVNSAADGWVRVYPCGTPPTGDASNTNPAANHIVANVAVVPLDSTGSVCFKSYAATDLVVDMQQWDPPSSGFTPVALTRVADTRNGSGLKSHLTPGTVGELQVTGANGVAANASAVVVNLTQVSSAPGWVVAYPCGGTVPLASNVNAWAGHAIANTAYVAVGTGGKICFASNITTDLVVDLQGWYPAGSTYHAMAPVRALDTRTDGSVTPGNIRVVPIAGLYNVPANATTVSVNITAVNASEPLFVKAYACGSAVPPTSNNNADPDRIVAAQALVPLGIFGAICLEANHTTDLVVDIQGYV